MPPAPVRSNAAALSKPYVPASGATNQCSASTTAVAATPTGRQRADRAKAAREKVGHLRMMLDARRFAVARRVVGRLVRRTGTHRQMGRRRGKRLFIEHAPPPAVSTKKP